MKIKRLSLIFICIFILALVAIVCMYKKNLPRFTAVTVQQDTPMTVEQKDTVMSTLSAPATSSVPTMSVRENNKVLESLQAK